MAELDIDLLKDIPLLQDEVLISPPDLARELLIGIGDIVIEQRLKLEFVAQPNEEQ